MAGDASKREQVSGTMSKQLSRPATEPAQQSPARQGYVQRPTTMDPQISALDNIQPTSRELLQNTAEEIGSLGQKEPEGKPLLVVDKVSSQDGYFLAHTSPEVARHSLFNEKGVEGDYATYEAGAVWKNFDTNVPDSKSEVPQWMPLSHDMRGEGYSSPLPSILAATQCHDGPQIQFHGVNNSNGATLNGPPNNSATMKGPNTISLNANAHQAIPNNVDQRLLNYDVSQPSTEQPAWSTTTGVLGQF